MSPVRLQILETRLQQGQPLLPFQCEMGFIPFAEEVEKTVEEAEAAIKVKSGELAKGDEVVGSQIGEETTGTQPAPATAEA